MEVILKNNSNTRVYILYTDLFQGPTNGTSNFIANRLISRPAEFPSLQEFLKVVRGIVISSTGFIEVVTKKYMYMVCADRTEEKKFHFSVTRGDYRKDKLSQSCIYKRITPAMAKKVVTLGLDIDNVTPVSITELKDFPMYQIPGEFNFIPQFEALLSKKDPVKVSYALTELSLIYLFNKI